MRSLRICSLLFVATAFGLSGLAKEAPCGTPGCRTNVGTGCIGPGCLVAGPSKEYAGFRHGGSEARGGWGSQPSSTINQACPNPGCLASLPQHEGAACPTSPCKEETVQFLRQQVKGL